MEIWARELFGHEYINQLQSLNSEQLQEHPSTSTVHHDLTSISDSNRIHHAYPLNAKAGIITQATRRWPRRKEH